MKNRTLILTNIILLCLVIVALITFMVMGINNKHFSFIENSKLVYEKTYTLSEIDKVKMDIKNYDIEILEGNSDTIKLEVYSNKDKENIKTNLNSRVLDLKQSGSSFCFGFCFYNQKIVLTVPKMQNLVFDLTTMSGDIVANTSFMKDNNNIVTTSGDIILENVIGGRVKSTSGDIEIEESEHLSAASTSGSVTIKKLKSGEVATTSGDIKIIQANKLSVASTSGDVTLGTLKGNGDIATTSGDIKIDYFEIFDKTSIKSLSGDVLVVLKNDARINTSTTSGDTKIKNSNGDVLLSIETMSGDIRVK